MAWLGNSLNNVINRFFETNFVSDDDTVNLDYVVSLCRVPTNRHFKISGVLFLVPLKFQNCVEDFPQHTTLSF